MRRLVVATTALLVMVGAAVVVGYLLLFSAVADRASRAVPADATLYLKVYLQPSTGQKMNLVTLAGRVPGFRDAATIDQKLHEIAQRLLGNAGMDYERDVRPWLGPEVALALSPPGALATAPHVLLLAVVRDAKAAKADLPRLMASAGRSFRAETYRGQQAMIGDAVSYALVDDLLLVTNSANRLRAAIDADANAAPSLADSAAFQDAMRALPADHLASVYLNMGGGGSGGYSAAALSLTAQADGLHLDGNAPFTSQGASKETRAAFGLTAKTASLAAWMPPSTRVEMVAFGLQQNLADVERRMATNPSFADVLAALNQIRGVAALGLGINLDRDLLSLFDGESAVALPGIDLAAPRPLLLLRPSATAAAAAALDRMRVGLLSRGSTQTTTPAAGETITSLTVPQVGRIAYAMVDGVVLLALDPGEIAAALDAHAAGATLANDDRYKAAFKLIGRHAGNEVWADLPGLLDASAGIFDPGTELRDILHQIGVLAMSASAAGDQLQIHAVLTVK